MLQLWRLVLLCGLLAGTSASPVDNNVVRELQSALRKQLETDDSASKSVLDEVKAYFELPWDFTSLEKVVTEKVQEEEILLDKNITKNLHLSMKPHVTCLSCEWFIIRSISIGNITFQETPEGISTNLSIPTTAKVTLLLPQLGAVVDMNLNFVLQTSIRIKINEAGALIAVIGECTYTPARISVPSVNSPVSSGMVPSSDISQTVTTLVNLVETYIVQYVLCPRIRTAMSSLDENLVQKLKGNRTTNCKLKRTDEKNHCDARLLVGSQGHD